MMEEMFDIDFKNKRKQLEVEFTVDDDVDIPLNSTAKIVSLDLMGTKGIDLILGDNTKTLSDGAEINSAIEMKLQEEVNAQILPLKNKAEELISSIDSLLVVVTSVLDKDARSSLTKSLVSLDNTFSTLSSTVQTVDEIIAKNQDNISDILTNVNHISTNIHNSNGKISNVINNLSSFSDSLSAVGLTQKIDKIDKVVDKLNAKEGFLGHLINDEELYNDLRSVLKEVDKLIIDVRNNPKRYVNFSIIGNTKKYVKPKSE